MKSQNDLRNSLRNIDHKSYPAYKDLTGMYQFPKFVLGIAHVQGDPFASPSSLFVEVKHEDAKFPAEYYANADARTALEDFLIRNIAKQFEQYNFKAKGSGKSGLIAITRCGQEVLERSACQIKENKLILRFFVGFPAMGRTINARELEKILFDFLPKCVEESLFYDRQDKKKVQQAVYLAEDQRAIRNLLKEKGWVAFVADNAVLPRKSGVSKFPMANSVPFQSPESLRETITLPHKGEISGMVVPKGITLIVGGGYHGKSTLLEAVQEGVYNHVAGDGREYVITDDTAIKLRAEDGRSVKNVDISMFINDLPNKKDTTSFSSEDASGSTSQAAGVIEGMEAGTKLFLIDEDTSATNFMVRDEFMQQVIKKEKEPITPFLERATDLYHKADISTILVAGSSGAFFHIADHIILMDCYKPVDITDEVKALCKEHKAPRTQAEGFVVPKFQRIVSAYKRNGRDSRHEHMKVKSQGVESFSLDKENINVRYLEQLIDSEQTSALAQLVRYGLEQVIDGKKTMQEAVGFIWRTFEKKGWELLSGSYVPCGFTKPRIQELYACFNRFRG